MWDALQEWIRNTKTTKKVYKHMSYFTSFPSYSHVCDSDVRQNRFLPLGRFEINCLLNPCCQNVQFLCQWIQQACEQIKQIPEIFEKIRNYDTMTTCLHSSRRPFQALFVKVGIWITNMAITRKQCEIWHMLYYMNFFSCFCVPYSPLSSLKCVSHVYEHPIF